MPVVGELIAQRDDDSGHVRIDGVWVSLGSGGSFINCF